MRVFTTTQDPSYDPKLPLTGFAPSLLNAKSIMLKMGDLPSLKKGDDLLSWMPQVAELLHAHGFNGTSIMNATLQSNKVEPNLTEADDVSLGIKYRKAVSACIKLTPTVKLLQGGHVILAAIKKEMTSVSFEDRDQAWKDFLACAEEVPTTASTFNQWRITIMQRVRSHQTLNEPHWLRILQQLLAVMVKHWQQSQGIPDAMVVRLQTHFVEYNKSTAVLSELHISELLADLSPFYTLVQTTQSGGAVALLTQRNTMDEQVRQLQDQIAQLKASLATGNPQSHSTPASNASNPNPTRAQQKPCWICNGDHVKSQCTVPRPLFCIRCEKTNHVFQACNSFPKPNGQWLHDHPTDTQRRYKAPVTNVQS